MKLFQRTPSDQKPAPGRMIKQNLSAAYILMWSGVVLLLLGLGAWYWQSLL